MEQQSKKYAEMVKKTAPKSAWAKNGARAFVCGGSICALGEALCQCYTAAGLSLQMARGTVSVTLIGLVALFTGLQIYDKFAQFAGAGSLVPITGFANAVVSPAVEFKPEGHIMGIGVKMFSIAGPVILYGTLASFLYGVILWLIGLFA